MKPKLNLVFYIAIVTVFIGIIFFVLHAGNSLPQQPGTNAQQAGGIHTQGTKKTGAAPLAVFVLQLIVTLAAAKLFGEAFKKAGQPAVIGEIIAGIVLGPSLMGALLPGVSSFLFPPSSLGNLQIISQAGLIFFMFMVGMELNINVLKNEAGPAIVISHSSIVIPFCLGVTLSYFLYNGFAPPQVPFYAFALFMGISMSITAFPVLARIIQERGLTGTRLGIIAISTAAVDDVTAWYLLGILLSVVKGESAGNALYMLLYIVLYLGCLVFIIKPLLKKLVAYQQDNEARQKNAFIVVILILLGSAYISERIGLHVLFGAFMAGTVIPRDKAFQAMLVNKIDIIVLIFLPLFFVFTGLNTNIFLLHDASLWATCALITGVAVLGKFVGSAVAAKIVGEPLKNSLIIGALLNTRGLMELIVLNIGYELGIFTPAVFTMMVLMALLTTIITGPALTLIGRMRD